jgi:hypothetical protein
MSMYGEDKGKKKFVERLLAELQIQVPGLTSSLGSCVRVWSDERIIRCWNYVRPGSERWTSVGRSRGDRNRHRHVGVRGCVQRLQTCNREAATLIFSGVIL